MNRSAFIHLMLVVGIFALLLGDLPDLSAREKAKEPVWAIALHGGAGRPPEGLTKKQRADYEQSLADALEPGIQILKNGGSSLDAVERVVRALESNPRLNAGKGAAFNIEGGHELHASIMDGRDRSCGAVAAVQKIAHPITAARRVMSESPFVLMVGEGAEDFVEDKDVQIVDPHYFDTKYRKKKLKEAREEDSLSFGNREDWIGTVGCVALDTRGNLAAGTSTGGVAHKIHGRMGDSSIIGAGNFADNKTCAVSCTGIGEYFIRNVVAYDVSALIEYKGLKLKKAVELVVNKKLDPDTGGIIAVAPDGSIAMKSNRGGMRRACANSKGRYEVHFWE